MPRKGGLARAGHRGSERSRPEQNVQNPETLHPPTCIEDPGPQ